MKNKFIISLCLINILSAYMHAQRLDIFFDDGTIQHFNYNESSHEIIIDHINKPIKKIETDIRKSEINKVVFSFISIDNISDELWDLFCDCEILKINFSKSSNLDFVKKFKKLKVLALQESNKISEVNQLDFSSNKKLEYLELEDIKMNIIGIVRIPKSVKYFVISYSKINENGYSKLKKINKNTVLVIDSSQVNFVHKNYFLAEEILSKLWVKYKVD